MATGTSAWPSYDDHWPADLISLESSQEFEAIDLGHSDIGDDATGFGSRDGIKESLGGLVGANQEIGRIQQKRKSVARRRRHRQSHGPQGHWPSVSSSGMTPRSVKRKIVPLPGLGSTVICPPWDSMMVREIDSPTPMPCRFVVTNG